MGIPETPQALTQRAEKISNSTLNQLETTTHMYISRDNRISPQTNFPGDHWRCQQNTPRVGLYVSLVVLEYTHLPPF
jgi:hypothetical protein